MDAHNQGGHWTPVARQHTSVSLARSAMQRDLVAWLSLPGRISHVGQPWASHEQHVS